MKDLMDFSRDQKVGCIEGLKISPRHPNVAKVHKMQEMEMGGLQGLPTDHNSINKLVGLNPGLNGLMNNQHIVSGGALSGSGQAAHALSNYQNLMTMQNSMNSTYSLQHEPASPFSSTTSNQPPTPMSSSILLGSVQNSPQLQSSSQNGNGFSQQIQSRPSNQALQQHMIQQLLQDMNNKKNGASASQPTQNPVGSVSGDQNGCRGSLNVPANVGNPSNGNNSFRAASNSEPPVGNLGFGQKATELPQNLHISDEMAQDIIHEFTENGFFNNDLDENFSWKA